MRERECGLLSADDQAAVAGGELIVDQKAASVTDPPYHAPFASPIWSSAQRQRLFTHVTQTT